MRNAKFFSFDPRRLLFCVCNANTWHSVQKTKIVRRQKKTLFSRWNAANSKTTAWTLTKQSELNARRVEREWARNDRTMIGKFSSHKRSRFSTHRIELNSMRDHPKQLCDCVMSSQAPENGWIATMSWRANVKSREHETWIAVVDRQFIIRLFVGS